MKQHTIKSEELYNKWTGLGWINKKSKTDNYDKDESAERDAALLFKHCISDIMKNCKVQIINSIEGSKSKTDGVLYITPNTEDYANQAFILEYKKRYYNSNRFTSSNIETTINEDGDVMTEFFGLGDMKVETPKQTEDNADGWILEKGKFKSIKDYTVRLKKDCRSTTKVKGFYINFFPDHTIAIWQIDNKEEKDMTTTFIQRPKTNSGTGLTTYKKSECFLLDIKKADIVIKIEK